MWFILLVLILSMLYYLYQRQYSYWKRRNVPGPDPVPLFGNVGKSLIGEKSIGEIVNDIYTKYDNYPFVGIYRGVTPCLVIRDIDFIKNIEVKDFRSFQNNDIDVDKNVDPLFGRNPFVLRGAEWKYYRSQLSPCFSSGKMKSIFPLISETGRQIVEYVEKQNAATNPALEVKALCQRFTLSNVALCAFGIDGKCFEDGNSYLNDLARRFLTPTPWTIFKMTLKLLVPTVANFITLKLVPKDADEEIITLVKNTVKQREENGIVRNDFLDMVTQIVRSSNDTDDINIAAHAASFLADGYETSAVVMTFVLFELAVNLDVQSKLRNHLVNSLEKNDQQFSYESVQEISYLDACVNEALRKHTVLFLIKTCVERYTYTPTDPAYKGISVTVEPGTPIFIPLGGLHNDPKYFPSPEKFMPERFLDTQKVSRYTFMPFGEGPRTCVGQRFGFLQVKMGVAYLIANFKITVNSRTPLPLEYDPWNFMLSPKGGLWLNFDKV